MSVGWRTNPRAGARPSPTLANWTARGRLEAAEAQVPLQPPVYPRTNALQQSLCLHPGHDHIFTATIPHPALWSS
jgi:hypothetical protein